VRFLEIKLDQDHEFVFRRVIEL